MAQSIDTLALLERPARITTASATPTPAQASKARLYTGRALTALSVAFLLFDAMVKVFEIPMALEGSVELGYSPEVVFPLGIILLACLALYAIPRTAVIGALLLTGYLGGAIATHVRIDNPLFSHTLFPIYVAILVWGGLTLRDARVRELFARIVS